MLYVEKFDTPMIITMEVDRIDTSIETVKCGLGITIVPKMSIKNSTLYTFSLTRYGIKTLEIHGYTMKKKV